MAAIIFDMDGTIADSFEYVTDFLAKESGLSPLTPQQKEQLRGHSMVGIARQLGFRWWQGPWLLSKGRRQMRKQVKHLDTFEGIPQIIKKLHNEGHELFVVSTNTVRNVRHFLHSQNLHIYFLEIYGGVGIFSKSSALRKLLKEQSFEAKDAVYVGDELRDVEAAQSLGIRAVAVSWGFAARKDLEDAKPTALVDTTDELMAELEKI